MPASAHGSTRLLIFLNPGRTSRHYLAAIARAAERLGILAGTIDLGPIWDHMRRGGPAAQRDATAQVRALLLKNRVTHVLGYVHNGALDFAVEPDPLGGESPVSPFVAAGARHILLWTDHPNGSAGGSALAPRVRSMLAHRMHHHWLKSPAAAAELRDATSWPNVFALPMAEDYDARSPNPDIEPRHDAVAIVSDAAPLPGEALHFLDDPDPDPAAITASLSAAALDSFSAAITKHAGREHDASLEALARDSTSTRPARRSRPALKSLLFSTRSASHAVRTPTSRITPCTGIGRSSSPSP